MICLEFPPPKAGGKNEKRNQDESCERDLPGEREHRSQDQDKGHAVADDVGENVGEGALRAADVRVQSAHQRSRLHAREEGKRHLLDMLEKSRAEVEYDASANGGGEIGLHQSERAVEEAENTHQDREPDDERGVALEDAVINDLAKDQGIDDANARVQNNDEKKERQKTGIGHGESQHALRGPRLYRLLHHRWVLHKGAHRTHHPCHSHSYSLD